MMYTKEQEEQALQRIAWLGSITAVVHQLGYLMFLGYSFDKNHHQTLCPSSTMILPF